MEKENKLAKFTVFVLLITIIALILVSGTYAKYTTSVTGSDVATVAKWSIKVGTTDIAKVDTIDFDLFSTIKDSDFTNNESDVKSGSKLIAPGTTGSFDSIILTNDSEVNAKYTIVYSVTNPSNIPLEFSTDKTTWKSDFSEINVETLTDLEMGEASADTATTVYWRWAYDAGRDTADTTLGTSNTAPQVTVTATITAQQAD